MAIEASVYIISLNAERTLAATLESVEDFAEVILVDSGSTDRTLEIAASYGVTAIHQPWLGFAKQKAKALSLCTYPWVLNLDADESLSPELKQEIADTIKKGDVDGLESPLIEKFLGVPNHRWTRRNYRVRFFRKDCGYYKDAQVHESVIVKGRVRRSRGGILHDGVPTIDAMMKKTMAYARLKSDEKFERGRQSSLAKLVLVFPVMFAKSYIFKRHFLNGRRGWIGAMNNAFYAFLKEAMLYEKELQEKLANRVVNKQKASPRDGS